MQSLSQRIDRDDVQEVLKARRMLLNAHYHLMDNKRFWYEKGLMEASMILCVIASDLKASLDKDPIK